MKFGKSYRNLLFSLLSLALLSGCAGVETVALSAAFGLAGQEGLDFYDSGTARKIIYIDQKDIEPITIQAFMRLGYRLEKKQIRSDDSVRFIGSTGDNQEVALEVTLSPVASGITDVKVTARHALVLPNAGACHQLMREIVDHSVPQVVGQISSID